MVCSRSDDRKIVDCFFCSFLSYLAPTRREHCPEQGGVLLLGLLIRSVPRIRILRPCSPGALPWVQIGQPTCRRGM